MSDDFDLDFPGFEEDGDIPAEDQDLAQIFHDALAQKEHTSIVNPEKYKAAKKAIQAIREIASNAIKNAFGEDAELGYSVEWGFQGDLSMVFRITLGDYIIGLSYYDIADIFLVLPEDCVVTIGLEPTGENVVEFIFRDVKTVIEQSRQ